MCSAPPTGQARWSVRLIAAEAVKRKLVPGVERETIRLLLQSHDLQPWREKMWCVADLKEEYIARREEVLTVYEQPWSADEPVVCWTRNPSPCTRRFAKRSPCSLDVRSDGIMSTNSVAPPTCFAGSKGKPGCTLPR